MSQSVKKVTISETTNDRKIEISKYKNTETKVNESV